jgi:hypothetical protein
MSTGVARHPEDADADEAVSTRKCRDVGISLDEINQPSKAALDETAVDVRQPLSSRERWNLFWCLLSWACTVAASTLGK